MDFWQRNETEACHHILAAGFGRDLQVLQFAAAVNSFDGGVAGRVEFDAHVPRRLQGQSLQWNIV